MKKLSQLSPNDKVIMYKNKVTKPHKSGHSHAITVPKSQFIDYHAKYIPCATLNKDYIIYKRVTATNFIEEHRNSSMSKMVILFTYV